MYRETKDCGCVHIPSHQSENGSWQPPETMLCDACEARLEQEEERETQRKETETLEKAYHILDEYQKKPELHPLFASIIQAFTGLEVVLDHLEGDAQ